MFKGYYLTLFILAYLIILFSVAYYAEKKEKAGKSIVSNPYIYALSLAVYCTSWTFYGSVGKAANSGLSFLTIYLGPTLIASLWWIILRKMIHISKENRLTTIADFIGSRYGNSISLSALVTVVAVVGITPYLGLQIKAIMTTFTILSSDTKGTAATGWIITLLLGIFSIIFGARKLDSSERHEGLVFAIAFESIVKLIAFVFVGVFVTYGLFDGFMDIFDKIKDSEYGELLFLGGGTSVSYQEWAALLFLSMMAIMFLPRQFQVAVVENSDTSHVSKAMWLFPLYLFLINIFVMPIAFGGLLLGGNQGNADSFVLTIPLTQGKQLLTLFAFIGGFSAATSMVIVESLALSTMIMNSLVMPGLYKFNKMKGFQAMLPWLIINVKRITILACVFLGYFFAVSIGEFYTLVDIGLKSFEAVTIFAPSILFGLYWKRGNKHGAIAGIIAGFVIWFYTLLMPALMKSGLLNKEGLFTYLLNSEILNPHALFSLKGLDKWSHSLFWGLFFNITIYVGLSIFMKQTGEEERQSLMFVDSYSPKLISFQSNYSVHQIEDILGQYIGIFEAKVIINSFIRKNNIDRDAISHDEIIRLRDEAERVLSGVLGSAISTIIFEDKFTLTAQEKGDLSNSIKQITDTLRFSRKELAEANRDLAYLKEFSENIIESAPVGIVTIDERLRIKYWNREMEAITDIKKAYASNRTITEVLPWIKNEMLTVSRQEECILQTPSLSTFKINISPFKDPSGGYVVIFENVTEKRKMEEHLLQSSKLASIGKLTAGISHEIGNPLASISSLIQELRSLKMDSREDFEFTEHSLNTVNTHIDRIARIVRSLGDFARVSSAEKMPSLIAEIVDRTINLVKYDKRFRNIQLTTDIADIPLLQLNPDKMQQVFLNIMLNAIDAMPNGGSLTVTARQNGSIIEMIFKDTGIGIEESVINKIFDPFFTTKPMGKGTGLGLSLCYGIIKEHNGSINVKSMKGEGTTLTIRLPLSA